MHSPQSTFPYLPRRSAPIISSRSPARRSKAVGYDDSDSSDLSSDDQQSPVHIQLKLKKPQLRSILKRSQPVSDGSKSGNRSYAITVVPYRSSCCGVVVRLEHVSEAPLNASKRSNGQCPSCETWGGLKSDPIDPHALAQSANMQHSTCPSESSISTPSLALPKSSRRRVQFAEHPIIFNISSHSQQPATTSGLSLPAAAVSLAQSSCTTLPPPHVPADAIYSLFNTDFGEAYPDSEHSATLGSSAASTDMYETFIRVMSVGGLTVLLYSVLT